MMQRFSRRKLVLILTTATTLTASAVAVYRYVAFRPSFPPAARLRREQWGALEPNLHATNESAPFDPLTNPNGWQIYTTPLDQTLTTIVIHHSALPVSDGPREIQQLHMHNQGLADIAYHFLIDAEGIVYEGRPVNVRGAHTQGHNTGTVGIVLLGNFEHDDPSKSQYNSLISLLKELLTTYHIGYLAGHRDFMPTETVCPGRQLSRLLADLAVQVGLSFGTEGYRKPDYVR